MLMYVSRLGQTCRRADIRQLLKVPFVYANPEGKVPVSCASELALSWSLGLSKHGLVQESGYGRELGEAGLTSFLNVKQVTSYKASKRWDWYPGAEH